ncbi:MAG: NAD(P)-dependent oxidoreductase [Anaerolineales bacterium]|nr:MAG: NAD(P)-dependent oxidoreductase [Anaerolineales bacterium]
MSAQHIVVTGGAGYIGSLLVGDLLQAGHQVTVMDKLLFGGDSLVAYLAHPNFKFIKADVGEPHMFRQLLRTGAKPDAIVHLAGIVGFPACQAVGKSVAWRYNVDTTKHVFEQAAEMGAKRFVFSSSYSNYGQSHDGVLVTEDSPLHPQSLYAETKIAAEEYLQAHKDSSCTPVIFRFATLFGISPRTRFDLIVNQFVLEAFTKRELLIYQRGYSRSFVHVRDIVAGIILGLGAPDDKVRGEIFNLGDETGNYRKDEIVGLIIKRLPEIIVNYKDLTFGGDMRDISVSFEKVRRVLGYQTRYTVDDGIRELLHALQDGLIKDPHNPRFRNAQFIVQ